MTLIADLILLGLFGLLCWKLTDGFRTNVGFMVPLLALAGLLRFVVLPAVLRAIVAG